MLSDSVSGRPDDEQIMLDFISTHVSVLDDRRKFISRYGTSIRAYLRVLLPTRDAADEVEQTFLLQVIEKGFPALEEGRGRFRDYLHAAVRNAARAWYRRRCHDPHVAADLSSLAIVEICERDSQNTLRNCVLDAAWNALRDFQVQTKGNLYFTILKTTVEHAHESSASLADRLSSVARQQISAESYRKQLSRARRKFAGLLVLEVGRTMRSPTPEMVDEKLQQLDLLKYVNLMLPRSPQ